MTYEVKNSALYNAVNLEMIAISEALRRYSGYSQWDQYHWATSVTYPAFKLSSERFSATKVPQDEMEQLLPQLIGARKIIDALIEAEARKDRPPLLDLLVGWWRSPNRQFLNKGESLKEALDRLNKAPEVQDV
jgi:hypothetical protein